MLHKLSLFAVTLIGLTFGLGGAPPIEKAADPFLGQAHAQYGTARSVLRQKERVDEHRIAHEKREIARQERQVKGLKRGLKELSKHRKGTGGKKR